MRKQYSFAVCCQNNWWTKGQGMHGAVLKGETIPFHGVKRPVWSGIKRANVVCLGKRKKAETAPAKSSVLWWWIRDRKSFQLCWKERTPFTMRVMTSEDDCMKSCLKVKSLQSSEECSNSTIVMHSTGDLVTYQKPKRLSPRHVRVTKMRPSDDLEAFLVTFEILLQLLNM